MTKQDIIPHLFRSEFSKIAAVLCKQFGISHMEIAEDIAGETFLAALETWPYKGIPEQPVAWLYAVAKNKARNRLKRDTLFRSTIAGQLKDRTDDSQQIEFDWSDQNISDSQLQMLFALCRPSIPIEAQIGLSLRILCGFGIDEIADAFLTNKETISKRLYRAKERLREENVPIGWPAPQDIPERLDAVLTTLYLLFNEGYYSESRDAVLREDLCLEAMRLTYLLLDYEPTRQPAVQAFMALMCFHASRFPARKDTNGEIVLYEDQDEALWNQELITKGAYYLREASRGAQLSKYHLEAAIAYWHTIKADTTEKWEHILQLYNRLLIGAYSPVAALNRTYAFSKVHGKILAIEEAEKLDLTDNHYYYTLLGELYTGIDMQQARVNYRKALTLAKTRTDKDLIQKKTGI